MSMHNTDWKAISSLDWDNHWENAKRVKHSHCSDPSDYGLGLTEDKEFKKLCKAWKIEPSKKLAMVYSAGMKRGYQLVNEIWP